MKNLLKLFICIASISNTHAQSKKEQIEQLTFLADSLKTELTLVKDNLIKKKRVRT